MSQTTQYAKTAAVVGVLMVIIGWMIFVLGWEWEEWGAVLTGFGILISVGALGVLAAVRFRLRARLRSGLRLMANQSDLIKATLIMAVTILVALSLWIYNSPYRTCLRLRDSTFDYSQTIENRALQCAKALGGTVSVNVQPKFDK